MIYQSPFAVFAICMWATHTHLAAKNLTTNEHINMRQNNVLEPLAVHPGWLECFVGGLDGWLG